MKLTELLKQDIKEEEEVHIKGSVVVEFEGSTTKLDKKGMEKYIRRVIDNYFTESFQWGRLWPKMSTFKIK